MFLTMQRSDEGLEPNQFCPNSSWWSHGCEKRMTYYGPRAMQKALRQAELYGYLIARHGQLYYRAVRVHFVACSSLSKSSDWDCCEIAPANMSLRRKDIACLRLTKGPCQGSPSQLKPKNLRVIRNRQRDMELARLRQAQGSAAVLRDRTRERKFTDLLSRKFELMLRLRGDPTLEDRADIERELAEIDAILNDLDRF